MPKTITPGRRRFTMIAAIAAAFTVTVVSQPAAAKEPPPYEYGPEPSWERYKELAEAAVRARLVDPDSAKIRWVRGFAQSLYKPMFSRRIHGYTACGLVNARNRMGGYNGETYFIVVIDYDEVRYLEIGQDTYSFVGEQCEKAALPPPLPPLKATPAPTLESNYGIAFSTAPGGISVQRVSPGSPAERAGLKPGAVITRINGLVVRGLTHDMAQRMLAGAGGSAVLSLESGAVITLERP